MWGLRKLITFKNTNTGETGKQINTNIETDTEREKYERTFCQIACENL